MGGDHSLLLLPMALSDQRAKPSSELVEHERRLQQAFSFSRPFILTYQPLLVVLVLAVAAWRSYTTKVRARQRQARKNETGPQRHQAEKRTISSDVPARIDSGPSSSSSSSTRHEYASPPQTIVSELTGLLSRDGSKAISRAQTSLAQTMVRWTRYVLTYQPPPLPVIKRTLPPNKTSLWIMFLFLLELFYLLFQVPLSPDTHTILGDRAGLLFIANLPWLYLLAAKTQPLKLLTGDSYENLNMLHRRLGEWLCFLAVVHLGGLLWGWYDFLLPAGLTLWWLVTVPFVTCGIGAWVAYEVLYLTSLGSFREWWYEAFLGSHIFLQIAALVLLFFHHFRSRPYVVISLAIFLLDRLAWRSSIKAWESQANLQVMEDGETVLVSADWPLKSQRETNRWRRLFGYDLRSGWRPYEHVFISIPGMGRKHKYQWHPITIASAAPVVDTAHAWFNLIVRAKGGFSRDLLHYAQKTTVANIRLDGPYGSMHAMEMLHESDVSIIVAGGSGIAVAFPLLWSLLHQPCQMQQVSSSGRTQQRVCLVWILHDASHISWIGTERLAELEQLGLHLLVPPPSGTHGRADVAHLLTEQVEHLAEPDSSIAVVVSGPDGLTRTVQNECARMVKRGLDVDVAVEKFEW